MNFVDSINSLCFRYIFFFLNFLFDIFDISFFFVFRFGVIICVVVVIVVLRIRILLLLFVASIGYFIIGEVSLLKGEVIGFYILGCFYRMYFK